VEPLDAFPRARDALAVVVTLVGVWAGVRGAKRFVRGFRGADDASAPLWIVRGIRGIVVAVGAGALGTGLLFEQRWLIVFGLVFLAEELYETGVLAFILRAGSPEARR
jgi:hypothetical protein